MLTGITRKAFISIPLIALVLLAGCASEAVYDNTLDIAINPQIPVSQQEALLYRMVNGYRAKGGLPIIPLSMSLTYVAQRHVRDLQSTPPSGKCNLHSWSGGGKWSQCCYTPDHSAAKCMLDKPRELTSYRGNGYEIAHGGTFRYQANAQSALKGWKGNRLQSDVILNRGAWRKVQWNSLGVGIYRGYAVLWFGVEPDVAAR